LLTLVSEFIGMTAAMQIFGIPPWITVIIVSIMMGAMVLQGRYWTWEKIALIFCVVNLIYIPAAFMVHPDWSQVIREGVTPQFPGGLNGALFFFMMANVGTTIAPWMVFFQQSAVVDKSLKEKDILWGQIDTAIGSFFTVTVGIFLIVVTGTVMHGIDIQSAAEAAIRLMGINRYAGTFLAIGLFDAGFLGAICISLSSSWAVGEVFGWAHSLNNKVREAPWFYAFYFLSLLLAGIVVLIPGAPLVTITLFVQVVATTLLPAALVFLVLLLNNEELMGKRKNTPVQNVIVFSIVVALILLSTGYSLTTLFPNWFG
jgi:Mn2+/Fe2+ NRAMP family transporter